MKYDCLIIDDEAALCEVTNEYFNTFGLTSAYATSFDEGLNFLKSNEVLLLLLDINLGNRSGFELCKELRKTTQLPILFISARQSDDDVLMALGIGGDIINACNIKIDIPASKAYLGEESLNLKLMEYKLLVYLIKNKNKVVTKDELFENVWSGGIVSDSTLNVHIRRLREKIERNPNEPECIKTIWGVGYIFEEVT